MPRSRSQPVMRALAVATSSPSRLTSALAEAISCASCALKASSQVSGSVERPSVGSTTQRIGRSKARAKAKSRLSWAGTAMIAPVPYPIRT